MPVARESSIGDIIAAVVANGAKKLSPEAAEGLLQIKFDQTTTNRIRQLLRKNNRGTISVGDRVKLENYLQVGQLLDLLHVRARQIVMKSAGNRDT